MSGPQNRWRSGVLGVTIAALSAFATVPSAGAAASAGTPSTVLAATYQTPVLTAVRAAHRPGYDRVVFEFRGVMPGRVSVSYVPALYADGSGLRVVVPGRAILRVVLRGAQAHTATGAPTVGRQVAFATPNVITAVRSGDFEGVVTYGLGVAQRSPVYVQRLTNPSRIVVDVAATLRTVNRAVYFTDQAKVRSGALNPITAVRRAVPAGAPATGILDRMYAGPTDSERAQGLTSTLSRSTGFAGLSIIDRVARVRLTGGCSSGGSAVVTVASQIMPALKQLPGVRWVKIYDPAGRTEHPYGRSDSIPECLEP